MSEEPQAAKGGVGTWFLKKFFISPATWIGLTAGSAAGFSLLDKGPLGGAIGFGSMIAVCAGLGSMGIIKAVQSVYRKEHKDAESVAGQNRISGERAIIDALRAAGQAGDADLLEKMIADREAIVKRCRGREDDADAMHTVELASAIVAASCVQAEELQDLVRRAEDPLLDEPEGSGEKIEGLRADLARAYQAVADARSRLRRGERLEEVDFLADADSLQNAELESLTRQLEEETAISRRVEDRLRPDRADWMDDEGEEDGPIESSGERILE